MAPQREQAWTVCSSHTFSEVLQFIILQRGTCAWRRPTDTSPPPLIVRERGTEVLAAGPARCAPVASKLGVLLPADVVVRPAPPEPLNSPPPYKLLPLPLALPLLLPLPGRTVALASRLVIVCRCSPSTLLMLLLLLLLLPLLLLLSLAPGSCTLPLARTFA